MIVCMNTVGDETAILKDIMTIFNEKSNRLTCNQNFTKTTASDKDAVVSLSAKAGVEQIWSITRPITVKRCYACERRGIIARNFRQKNIS